jgi:hypothetical protein
MAVHTFCVCACAHARALLCECMCMCAHMCTHICTCPLYLLNKLVDFRESLKEGKTIEGHLHAIALKFLPSITAFCEPSELPSFK